MQMMTSTAPLTYSGLLLAVFARQVCLPVPALLFLITAGALAANGQMSFALALLMGVLGCLAGDGVWFWLGRRWRTRVIRLVCSLSSDPRNCVDSSQKLFLRWGLRILVVAKFVPGLDGVTPPLAGAEGAGILQFVGFDTVGAVLWSGAYLSLGALFSHQLERGILLAKQFGFWAAVFVGVPLIAFAAWRGFHLLRVILHLRLRRISPAMLSQKLGENARLAVFDLQQFEMADMTPLGIPGAVRIRPARLRLKPYVVVPEDIEIVLYCSSPNEITSVRVASALENRGIANVWVLEGGLSAWVAEGHALAELSNLEEVARRLGVALPDWPADESERS